MALTLVVAGCMGAAGVAGAPAASALIGVPVPAASDAGRLPPFGPIGLERVTIPLGTLDVPGFLATGPLVAALDQVPAGPGELYTVGRLQAYGIRTLDGRVSIRTAIAEIGHIGPINELAPYLPGPGHLVFGDGSWEVVPPGTPGYLFSRPQYRVVVFPLLGAVEVAAHVPAAMAPRTAVRGLFTGLDPAYLALILRAMWPAGPPRPVTYAANDPWLGLLDPGAAEWPGADVGVSLLDVVGPALGPIFTPMLSSLTGGAGAPAIGPALLDKLAPLSSQLGPLLDKAMPLLTGLGKSGGVAG
ncbi:hypothetical protein [Pseudofrankia sp. BMG5.37]|uniref:hypothetical protein n=1 Tax=Pseudofrankia sp. BMG5.37 TaxID=3050035 RepID=UPI002895562C|nr:hypothetical protein [Pseudofrankia sp. BMG5.37]MDT3440416.1 hypothetical protein [Pseudofrankia sp. BMG5.37]